MIGLLATVGVGVVFAGLAKLVQEGRKWTQATQRPKQPWDWLR